MKWSSPTMVGGHRRIISATVMILVITGLIVGNEGGYTSISAFYLAFIAIFSGLIFWNMFDYKASSNESQSSTPGVTFLENNELKNEQFSSVNEHNNVDPLDYDIEIPLL